MRFMVIVRADADSESGAMPSEELLTKMGQYNEELVKAGVMIGGEGLHPSSRGARVRFSGAQRDVIDGPFAETKELIAGYWLFKTQSLQEAIEWVKRAPFDGGADLRHHVAIGFGPLQKPAIGAEDFLLGIAGHEAERFVAKNDGIIGLPGIGDDHRHPRRLHGGEEDVRLARMRLTRIGDRRRGYRRPGRLFRVSGPVGCTHTERTRPSDAGSPTGTIVDGFVAVGISALRG